MPDQAGFRIGLGGRGLQLFARVFNQQHAEDAFALRGVEHFADPVLLPAAHGGQHLVAILFHHLHFGGRHQVAGIMAVVCAEEERFGGDGVEGGGARCGQRRGLGQLGGAGLGFAAHVRQDVGHAFMAVDAGFALFDRHRVLQARLRALGGDVHGVVAVAGAAGGRVVLFQRLPDRLRHRQLVRFIFFRRIDGADHLAVDVFTARILVHR